MHPDLKNLRKLAEADIEIASCEKLMTQLDLDLADAMKAISQASQQHALCAQRLSDLKSELRNLIKKAVLYNRQKQGAEQALAAVIGDAQAAIRQIERCDELLDQNETDQLKLFDNEEAALAELRNEELTVSECQSAHDALLTNKPTSLKELNSRLAAAKSSRDDAMSHLASHILSRYHLLKSRRGVAVALFKDGACKTCHTVPPQRKAIDIKRGRVETCSRCGRWLVPV